MAFGATHRATPASGPILSLKGMMAALGQDFEFLVLAKPQLGLPNTVDIPSSIRSLATWLNATPHDLVYLNSFFDREFTLPILALRKARLIQRRPVLVAPRGELLTNALSIKSKRKHAFLWFARRFGIYRDAWLHATSSDESSQSRAIFPWTRGLELAAEIPPEITPQQRVPAEQGLTRLSFIGRISPVKNLDLALGALALTRSRIQFCIYGPLEDARYWAECQRLMAKLPANVSANYCGVVAAVDIPAVLAHTDLLFLPGKGENFGHAIFEALSCGVPVLIGNATPWHDLVAAEAGWDLPLNDPSRFAATIDQFAGLDEAIRDRLRNGARCVAKCNIEASDAAERMRQLFGTLIADGQP